MIQQAARDFAQNECLPGVIERDEKMQFPKEQILTLGHDSVKNKPCFRAIANMTQVGIENGKFLFQVFYYDNQIFQIYLLTLTQLLL